MPGGGEARGVTEEDAGYELQLWTALRDRLVHELRMNTASGYVLDPRLPVLEVFERPGWRVHMVERNSNQVEMARVANPGLASFTHVDAPIPYSLPDIERVVFKPIVKLSAYSSDWGGWRWFGLGFSADERLWLLFSGDGRLPEWKE